MTKLTQDQETYLQRYVAGVKQALTVEGKEEFREATDTESAKLTVGLDLDEAFTMDLTHAVRLLKKGTLPEKTRVLGRPNQYKPFPKRRLKRIQALAEREDVKELSALTEDLAARLWG